MFHFILLLICAAKAQKPTTNFGKIVYIKYTHSAFINEREVAVWLPENYDSNQKYSVLYMHDAKSLFDTAVSWNHQSWEVDETMQQLMAENKIKNTIVVGIYNAEWKRRSEFFPKKIFDELPHAITDSLKRLKDNNNRLVFNGEMQSDNYLKFIVQELKPYVDSEFSTFTDAEHTLIAGSSMGGLISIYALCEYPLIFGGAACLSTHWNGTGTYVINEVPEAILLYLSHKLPLFHTHKIYFDFGSVGLDSLYKPYQIKMDSIMMIKKYDSKHWITREFIGDGHDENSWKKRLHIPLTYLLNP